MTEKNKVDKAIDDTANKVDIVIHEVISSKYVRLAFKWAVSIFGGGAIGLFTAVLADEIFSLEDPEALSILAVVGIASAYGLQKFINTKIS